MSPQSTDNLDLAVTAQQYVAGELPAREVTAFEELLANDEQAQAALADVVLLTSSLSQQDSLPSVHRQNLRTGHRKSYWTFSKALVMLVIVAVCASLLIDGGMSPEDIADHQRTAELRRASNEAEVAELWVSMSEDFETVSSPVEEQPEAKSDSLYDVPDWLFAAVEADNSEMGDMDSLGMDPLNMDEEETL